jgi:hypothetical protein
MSEKVLELNNSNVDLHSIETYMFQETSNLDPFSEIISKLRNDSGFQKNYIDAYQDNLVNKLQFYSKNMMKINEDIQEEQNIMFRKRCSYNLQIHYAEFKFFNSIRNCNLYIGIDLTTGLAEPKPSKEFYKDNFGFEDSDFFVSATILANTAASMSTTTTTTITTTKGKGRGRQSGATQNKLTILMQERIQFIQEIINNNYIKTDSFPGIDPKLQFNKDMVDLKLSTWKDDTVKLYKSRSYFDSYLAGHVHDTLQKLLQGIKITPQEVTGIYQNLPPQVSQNLINDDPNKFIKWLDKTEQILTNPNYTLPFGRNKQHKFGSISYDRDYEIPDFVSNEHAKNLNELFKFYTSGNYTYVGVLPLPSPQDANFYYTHHGTNNDIDGNDIQKLCDFWGYLNTNYTEDKPNYEEEQKMRTEYVSLLELREANSNLSVKVRRKIEKLKNSNEQLIQVDKIIKIIEEFNDNIRGNARIDIKLKVAKVINTFVRSPTFYRNKYLNISLTGGAGTGKTSIAIILGKLFSELGLLITEKFKLHTRATLVGQYVGQTASITRNALIDSLEGVMFVDEAYALTQSSGKEEFDPYGIESISEFINFMDKNKGRIAIITAGYHTDIDKYWFGPNEGMRRRMPNQWKLLNYSFYDLTSIFAKMYRDEQKNLGANVLPINMYDIFDDAALQNLFGKLVRSCDLYYKQDGNESPKKITTEKDLNNSYALLKNQAGDIENVVARFTEYYISEGSRKITSNVVDNVFNDIYFKYDPKKYILYSSYLTYPNEVTKMYNFFKNTFNSIDNQNTVALLLRTLTVTPKKITKKHIKNEIPPPLFTQTRPDTPDQSDNTDLPNFNVELEDNSNESFYSAYSSDTNDFGRLRRNYVKNVIKRNKHLLKKEHHRKQALQIYLMSLHNTNHL